MIIGITGGFGSGKTTATSYLNSEGFKSIRLSDFLEEEAKKRGVLKITRKVLQDIGNEWRHELGSSVLSRKALDLINKSVWTRVVIDGIRNVAEVEELRKNGNFILVGILSIKKTRFERARSLKRRENLTRDLFQKLDRRDMGLGQKKYGLQVRSCLSVADIIITNNGTKEELERKLKSIITDG